ENAASGDDGQVFAPNIIIESYDFGGDFVTAGQKFPLTVLVKNTSSSASIENLKITVNGASSSTDGSIAYSPANSSNSFFFENLGTRDTAEVKLDLLAKADAAPNSYPIILTFTYEYSVNGKRQQAHDVTETITIPLQQEDRLTINQIEAPNYGVNVGMQCSISTSLVNKGKSGVYNVTAKVEGEGFEVSTGSYYIGNVASGTEEYYDAQITPYMEGEISGEVVITYEDANGAAKEQRMPFSFTAMNFYYDEGMIDDGGFVDPSFDPGMAEQGGDMTWLWFVIGGGAALVIAVVIIIICVVRKKKRSKELEDDDEDI
ncbi:MAG: GGIII-like transmembrane region-containing protein, partial [Ruminiclostridium sp.]